MAGGFPNQVPHLTFCEVHQKKAFTKKNAKKLIRQLPLASGMRRYPCRYIFNGWHAGRLPLAVLLGEISAGEYYREAA